MSKDDACAVLAALAGWDSPPDWMDPYVVGLAYKDAAKRVHPDAGGSTEDFQRLQDAKRVLDGAS